VEYVAKLNDVMYQVSNHKKKTLATTCAYWSWRQRWCRRVRHMAYW
jgi:hypothetical protein